MYEEVTDDVVLAGDRARQALHGNWLAPFRRW
jgi:hypothetical protein